MVARELSTDPYVAANRSLAEQVSTYRRQLEALGIEREALEQKLKNAEKGISEEQSASADERYWDHRLTKEEWSDLARQGKLRWRQPCEERARWEPSADRLKALGLDSAALPAIRAAFQHSYERRWARLGPLCRDVLQVDDSVPPKLGEWICGVIVSRDWTRRGHDYATSIAEAARIRAGERGLPTDEDGPSLAYLYDSTLEGDRFEDELAHTFGGELARKMVYSGALCTGGSGW